MSWRLCATSQCPTRIREGLRRQGEGADGQPLADGRFCWKCRAKQTTTEDRRRAKLARDQRRAAPPPAFE